MDELSGKKIAISDEEAIDLGFCPHCLCSQSKVVDSRKKKSSTVRLVKGEKKRVLIQKVVRYRECDACGKSFRTTETVD